MITPQVINIFFCHLWTELCWDCLAVVVLMNIPELPGFQLTGQKMVIWECTFVIDAGVWCMRVSCRCGGCVACTNAYYDERMTLFNQFLERVWRARTYLSDCGPRPLGQRLVGLPAPRPRTLFPYSYFRGGTTHHPRKANSKVSVVFQDLQPWRVHKVLWQTTTLKNSFRCFAPMKINLLVVRLNVLSICH